MTQTERFAFTVAGKAGVGEDVILAIILALLQTLPALCPARRLKRMVRRNEDDVKHRVARQCRKLDVDESKIPGVGEAVVESIGETSVNDLAEILAENQPRNA